MDDHPTLPDFGDKLGLHRRVRWTKDRFRASEWPPAERAARAATTESPPAA